VLAALSRIIDPDFGQDVVTCGFVRDLAANRAAGSVRFRLQLTTPACPVKAEFERQVGEIRFQKAGLRQACTLPEDLATSSQTCRATLESPRGSAELCARH